MVSERAAHAPIMLAEDDENDVLFMKLAFRKAGLQNPLMPVHDGEEAIEYLSGLGRFADRDHYPLPCLVLTDLKMPRVNGLELLAWIKARPEFEHIPTIVLSSSNLPEDRERAKERGAADYWVKPGRIDRLMSLVTEMRDTWVAAHCA